jgi:hypothetical protein
MKTENPIELLARLEREARAQAGRELEQIRNEGSTFRRSEFSPPDDASVETVCRAWRSNDDRRAELRRRASTFDPIVRADELLDIESNRPVLEAALTFLKAKIKVHRPTPAPERRAEIADDGYPIFIPARTVHTGGLFGSPAALSLAQKLAKAEALILDFPVAKFTACTSALHDVASTMIAEARPAPVEPFRQPFPLPARCS